MSIHIEDNDKHVVRSYYTSSKIEESIENLLKADEELMHSETLPGYKVDIVEEDRCEYAISRQEVIDLFAENADDIRSYSKTWEEVKNLPSVTLGQKKGKWIKEETIHGWDGFSYQCSECGRSIHLDTDVEDLTDFPYCHCGAEMEVEK